MTFAQSTQHSYVISSIVKENAVLLLGGSSIHLTSLATNSGAKVVFTDLLPGANWAHPAKIEVIAPSGAVLETIATRLPPLRLHELPKSALNFDLPILPPVTLNDFGGKYKVAAPEHFFAVMINGSADLRHYNDFVFLYRTLTQVYGYLPQNIFVADSAYLTSAPDLDGDGKADIQYASTNQSVTDLLAKVKGLVTSNDQLLIATDDHGDTQDGESTLYLYDGEMKASAFTAMVNAIPAGRVLAVHEPCYSGGLVRGSIMPGRAAMAAATNAELSWGSIDGNFDEFILHVITAFAMQTPDGKPIVSDLDGDGKINAREAFVYALAHDARPESPLAEDTPDSGFISTIGFGF